MNMTKKILEIHPTSPLADVEHSDGDLQIILLSVQYPRKGKTGLK